MAPPFAHYKSQETMQGSIRNSRVRVHDHPDIPIRSDRVHGLLQGRAAERHGAGA